MKNYKIPKDIEQDVKEYMKNVSDEFDKRVIIYDADSSALIMLARNYSMFIKASKQREIDCLSLNSDRGNLSPYPAIKLSNDSLT